MSSAYDKTKTIIRDTINEFGGNAHNLEEIVVDRIKDNGLKIEHRANAKPEPKADTDNAADNGDTTDQE